MEFAITGNTIGGCDVMDGAYKIKVASKARWQVTITCHQLCGESYGSLKLAQSGETN